MISLTFNKNKPSLLNNELYYSRDQEQKKAIYRIVTNAEEACQGSLGYESVTTYLYHNTAPFPVGEISLRSRYSDHQVLSGSRNIKPSTKVFGGL